MSSSKTFVSNDVIYVNVLYARVNIQKIWNTKSFSIIVVNIILHGNIDQTLLNSLHSLMNCNCFITQYLHLSRDYIENYWKENN